MKINNYLPDEDLEDAAKAEYLRLATEADMDLLYDWANDSQVRKNSFDTGEIAYAEHQIWFHKILSRKDCVQYIYMEENEPIGQARITVLGDEVEIGYSICGQKRGQGYGTRLLELLRRQVGNDFPEVKKMIGKVKPGNIASKKAFEQAGFLEQYSVFEMSICQDES